jgi:hypothetical protein
MECLSNVMQVVTTEKYRKTWCINETWTCKVTFKVPLTYWYTIYSIWAIVLLLQHNGDYVRGCTWQLKKIKSIYTLHKLVLNRGDSSLECCNPVFDFTFRNVILYTYWLDMRVIALLLSPWYQSIFRGNAEENSWYRGNN